MLINQRVKGPMRLCFICLVSGSFKTMDHEDIKKINLLAAIPNTYEGSAQTLYARCISVENAVA